MAAAVACPDAISLSAYAHGTLPIRESGQLERHLAQCDACLTRYRGLPDRSGGPSVPDCRVIREIGRGASGIVYKAWWLASSPRIVALKIVRGASDAERSRFHREIAVLQKLDARCVARCLEWGASGDALYFIMDYIDGVHLDQYLGMADEPATPAGRLSQTRTVDGEATPPRPAAPMALPERLRIFQRVCAAVAEAHRHGVVHRDLKPRNILIDPEGRPYVVDFGICAVDTLDWTTAARMTITQPGAVIGTLKYMSPEQAWGGVGEAVDQRSDVWALGVMLYEIVTDGGHPYSLRSTRDKPAFEALLDRLRRELPEIPHLAHLPRGRDLRTLLERALTWEADARLPSAQILADDLERYLNAQPVRTRPHGTLYRGRRLLTGVAIRSRWALWVSLVALAGLAVWAAGPVLRMGWYVEDQALAAGDGSTANPAEQIAIIGVGDHTADAVLEFAAEQDWPDVTSQMKTWRAVHARLLDRLLAARPAVVIWDYYFPSAQPGDEALGGAIVALEAAGVPVVVGSGTYDDAGRPDTNQSIVDAAGRPVRHGAIVARDMVNRPGEFVTAIKRPDGVVLPSLPLAAVAALRHPDARLELESPGRSHSIDMLYRLHEGAYRRERDRVETMVAFAAQFPFSGVREGDLVAVSLFELRPPQTWQARTFAYEDVLTAADDLNRGRLRGRLVMIGDVRSATLLGPTDRHRVRYGTTIVPDVPGCWLMADALLGLLSQRRLRLAYPLPAASYVCVLAAGAIGCAAAVRLSKRETFDPGRLRGFYVAAAVLALAAVVLAAWTRHVLSVHAGMAAFAFTLCVAGSLWVEAARNRHRILDRKRRALEQKGVAPALRSTTMASPPGSSTPAAP